MKRSLLFIIVLAAFFVVLLCGCFDDGHYYGTYDYNAIDRFLDNYQEYEIKEYFVDHYSLHDIVEMYGYEAIRDEAIGSGWFDDYNSENYNDGFHDGYSEGYNVGYDDGWNTGYTNYQSGASRTFPNQAITPRATPQPTQIPSRSTATVSETVYITNTGTKYHRSGCSYLSQSKIAISLNDAKARGYTPCSRCW